MLRAIESGSTDEFGQAALAEAVDRERRYSTAAGCEEAAEVCALLPHELQPIRALPKLLRECFVLRLLAGIPVKHCATLLHLTTNEVETFAAQAAVALALKPEAGTLALAANMSSPPAAFSAYGSI